MSEIKDSTLYNFYDFVKTIYIYSHVKTHLIDSDRQNIEKGTNILLLIMSYIFVIVFGIKFFVILFYFIFLQAFSAFIKFIKSIIRTKCNLNFHTSFSNAMYYLGKVFKRIYTFNFYIFHNRYIGSIMINSYFFYLISSLFFYHQNIEHIEEIEKSKWYMFFFYCHFESIILIQLLCSSFYACPDTNISILLSIGLFISMNAMLFLAYLTTDIIENVDGSVEHNEPQNVMNIIFNSLFLSINVIALFKIIFHKNNCKLIFFYLFFIYSGVF